MHRIFTSLLFSTVAVVFSTVATAEVPQQVRTSIDRITGGKGSYVSGEGVYKVIFPREEATIVTDDRTLSPNLSLNSWVALTSAIHHEAVLTGQFLLLDDEANAVLAVVLDAGLEVTGLAPSPVFDGPRVQVLEVTGVGTFQNLAGAFRKGLDEVRRVRRTTSRPKSALPAVPISSAIDAGPLDTVLSMKGTVVGGVYQAAIGKRAVLHGEQVGREMGMSTWVSFAGTNDRAVAQGEFVETADDLKKVLTALRAKGINIASIRNHTFGEQPQFVFVRFWGQATALELARALRYVLDIEVGAISPSGTKL
ncbi:MAG TPA: DUF1259 domain-containing protein [Terriglobales bacterium]|nr:DUF1259 domain-containing protein [Terriglobales bacterium]